MSTRHIRGVVGRRESSRIDQLRRPGATDAWRRWTIGWDLLIYALLTLGVVVASLRAARGAGGPILIVALSVAFGFWYGYVGSARKLWTRGRIAAAGFLAIEAGLWLGLMLLDPIFIYVGFGMLAHVCSLSLGWSIAVAVIFGGGTVLQELLEPGPTDALVAVPAVVGAAVIVLVSSLFINVSRRSEERRRLISELDETRADLAAAEREAGMLAERHRLARDIHDTLAQGFTSIVMLLEAAEAELTSNPARAQTHIDRARATARESLAEARGLVWALRAHRLVDRPLSEAVEALVHRLTLETSVRAQFEVVGDRRPLPPAVDECILRVAQEALANVRRHADAAHVTVTLIYDDEVSLVVRDDGRGIEPGVPSPNDHGLEGGLGLRLMRERVERLGGARTIDSHPDRGTTVVVRLPVPSPSPLASDTGGAS